MSAPRYFGIVLVTVALGIPSSAARADEGDSKQGPATIRVSGDATIQAKPDQATVTLGVTTEAATGQAAAAQNAQKQDAVIAELRKVLGPGAEIKTISYSLNPNYRYPKEGGQPTIAGYNANNTILVRTPDLTQVGKIIDIATQKGSNIVGGLSFSLKDEDSVRLQALREAAVQARGKADALAAALKLKIVRVLRVDEGGQPVTPIYAEMKAMRAMDAGAPPTPVEPGTVEVRASVSLAVEIAQ